MPENLQPWQRGQSGNPEGYSQGRRFTDGMLRLIDEEGADPEIHRMWLARIKEGDFRFFKEFMDRVEGKVGDKAEEPPDPVPLSELQNAALFEAYGDK